MKSYQTILVDSTIKRAVVEISICNRRCSETSSRLAVMHGTLNRPSHKPVIIIDSYPVSQGSKVTYIGTIKIPHQAAHPSTTPPFNISNCPSYTNPSAVQT